MYKKKFLCQNVKNLQKIKNYLKKGNITSETVWAANNATTLNNGAHCTAPGGTSL